MTNIPNPTILDLRELVDINSLDFLPILDIDGGSNGRPKTKRVKLSRLQAFLALGANNQRIISSVTTTNLASNENYLSGIAIAKSFVLVKASSNKPTRIRLYSKADKQAQDLNRNIGVKPLGQHNLILEVVTALNSLNHALSPQVIGANCEDIPVSLIPITITNLSSSNELITVNLEYLILET